MDRAILASIDGDDELKRRVREPYYNQKFRPETPEEFHARRARVQLEKLARKAEHSVPTIQASLESHVLPTPAGPNRQETDIGAQQGAALGLDDQGAVSQVENTAPAVVNQKDDTKVQEEPALPAGNRKANAKGNVEGTAPAVMNQNGDAKAEENEAVNPAINGVADAIEKGVDSSEEKSTPHTKREDTKVVLRHQKR
jgi:hypothetical protein